jgi:AbrB family looped-hinge helix DNA binding protein
MTSKGQITIPKNIRDSLNLNTGDKFEFILTQTNDVILRPVTKKVDDVFGLLAQYRKSEPISIEKMDELVKQKQRENFQ